MISKANRERMGDLREIELEPHERGSRVSLRLWQPLQLSRQLSMPFGRSSIMIHADGDNYSDSSAPLGGGGARIACGAIH